ncbi:Phosphatidylinositide phosphatase SAC2 [Schistosoma japonicum]|nr:Phosphatidylinositide phosphatase SAC2 [Schistosoma japonicum]
MDLIETNTFYIIINGSQALYCDRLNGKLTVRHASDIINEWNPICLGKVDGVIGKIRYHADSDWRLFLISGSKPVGILPDGLEVRRISRITVLVLNTSPTGDLNLTMRSTRYRRRGIDADGNVANYVETEQFCLK